MSTGFAHVTALVGTHGYWIVGIIVALESMGVPAPGETTLITAALYAGTTHQVNVVAVVAAAAAGAIIGDNLGYAIGRTWGLPLLRRHGRLIGLDERRLALGQLLFARHGGKVVFFGRFVALLRAGAALLAGLTRMEWRRFLVCNAAGGATWAALFGFGAYSFGQQVVRLERPVAIAGAAAAVIAFVYASRWLHRYAEAAVSRTT